MDAYESTTMGDPSQQDSKSITDQTQDGMVELLNCCKQTIDMHAAKNPMMVCSTCKQIIKCFDKEKAFINYQRFCASRHRRILATTYAGRHTVVFRSYDTYST